MKRYLCSLVALGLLQGLTGQLKAQPTYSFTTLDGPGTSVPASQSIRANGINDSGQIVGTYLNPFTAYGFLLDNGSYTTLDLPRSTWNKAHEINASAQIVGAYSDAAGTDHGFLLDNGSYTTLDVPGWYGTYAKGINASGQIVGYSSSGFSPRI